MYIPYVLTGEWRLGRGLCKLWLVVDYMLCTASVFNIVLISFDRFQSVTKAVSAVITLSLKTVQSLNSFTMSRIAMELHMTNPSFVFLHTVDSPAEK